MATHTYWIPRNHRVLRNQANQTANYLSDPQHRERMGFNPTTPQGRWVDDEFYPKFHDFIDMYLEWENPSERTTVKTLRLREAESGFKAVYRQLYTGFLKANPLVTDNDLVSMGLPKRRQHVSNHTPPLPNSYPKATVTLREAARIEFRIRDSASARRAKPAGVHGVEIKWDILDRPPVNISDMIHTALFTKSPFILDVDYQLRGKTLYFALRWESTRGENGVWSEIRHTIIA
ncbi:MAG: hypothetical protein LBD52_07660 [Prevotellaceae bacterium]|jgi:hypothetical protein|nr:hypothetical protein [Prevotellaceae bacterium]